MASTELVGAVRTIARAIAATLGEDCEVAVHDLRDPTRSLVQIENGHVTGRSLGAPIRDLIVRVLPALRNQEDMLCNYLTELEDGRRLKSTTCVITDENGKPVLALCINLDLTRLTHGATAISDLTRIDDNPAYGRGDDNGSSSTNDRDVSEMLSFLISNVIRSFGNPLALSKAGRLQAIEFLERKGAFLIKGSVPMVAQALGVSEPTVYRYLDDIRSTNKILEATTKRGPTDEDVMLAAVSRTSNQET